MPPGDTTAVRDFLYGVDPTGRGTFYSGMTNQKDHAKHKAISTIGGFLGGAAIIPGLSGGVVRGTVFGARAGGGPLARLASAGKGFVEGAAFPYRMLLQGAKAESLLKALKRGEKVEVTPEVSRTIQFLEDVVPISRVSNEARQILTKNGPMAASDAMRHAVEAAGNVDSSIGKAMRSLGTREGQDRVLLDALAKSPEKLDEFLDAAGVTKGMGMGLLAAGGAVNAGSALVQYGAGRRVGNMKKESALSDFLASTVAKKMGAGTVVGGSTGVARYMTQTEDIPKAKRLRQAAWFAGPAALSTALLYKPSRPITKVGSCTVDALAHTRRTNPLPTGSMAKRAYLLTHT